MRLTYSATLFLRCRARNGAVDVYEQLRYWRTHERAVFAVRIFVVHACAGVLHGLRDRGLHLVALPAGVSRAVSLLFALRLSSDVLWLRQHTVHSPLPLFVMFVLYGRMDLRAALQTVTSRNDNRHETFAAVRQ